MAEQGQKNIPKALRDAEENLATAQQEQEQGAPADTATTEHSENPQSAENGTQDTQSQETSQSQEQASGLTQGAQALGGNTAQATPTKGEEDPNSDTWKQRYQVIDGKYRAETAQLRQRIEQLETQLQQAQSQPQQAGGQQEAEGQPKAQPSAATAALETDPEKISDEEVRQRFSQERIDEFGLDYCKQDLAAMRKEYLAMQTQPQSDQRVDELENRINQTEKEKFYSELDKLVPDWEQINNSQEWQDFLGQYEPLTGVTYEALLQDATDKFDSVRVSQLFNRFKEARGQSSGQSGNQPSVESQTMPESTSSAAGSPGNQGNTMSFEEWDRQMAALAQHPNPTSPEVMDKQKKLDAAMREGRVIGAPGSGTEPQPTQSFV